MSDHQAVPNNLQTYAEKYPELDNMFNDALNNRSFASVRPRDLTTVKYWWTCLHCGQLFKKTTKGMIRVVNTDTMGCPNCARKKRLRGQSFADIHPELMDEYASDNTINPYEVFVSSKHTVKWICRNNPEHTWEASFELRHVGFGKCKECKRIKKLEERKIALTVPTE